MFAILRSLVLGSVMVGALSGLAIVNSPAPAQADDDDYEDYWENYWDRYEHRLKNRRRHHRNRYGRSYYRPNTYYYDYDGPRYRRNYGYRYGYPHYDRYGYNRYGYNRYGYDGGSIRVPFFRLDWY